MVLPLARAGIPALLLVVLASSSVGQGLFGLDPLDALGPLGRIATRRFLESPTGRAAVVVGDLAAAEAWGRAGQGGYPLAAVEMLRRNGPGAPLTAYQKAQLRPFYGALVDKVSVAYSCQMMDEIKFAGKEFPMGESSGAQTFGYRIYVDARHKARDPGQITLLAHELMHTKQYVRFGAKLNRFGYRYFKAFYNAGMKYAANPLEKEAEAAEEAYEKVAPNS